MNAERTRLAARLHLEAVFPALEDLTALSPQGQGLGHNRMVVVQAGEEGKVCFRSQEGRLVRVDCAAGGRQAIGLDFRNSVALVRAAEGKLVLPRMVGLARHPLALVRLILLLKRLDSTLKSEATNRRELILQAGLLLIISLRASAVLVEGDAICRRILGGMPTGVVKLSVADGSLGPHFVEHLDGRIALHGEGMNGRENVEICFQNADTLGGILRDRMDSHAAVASGSVRVRGLLPLADGLGMILDRVAHYLPVGDG
ncbi:MAG: hypothetical protein ACFCU4_09080 [Puniceicoccaceae bacterium]